MKTNRTIWSLILAVAAVPAYANETHDTSSLSSLKGPVIEQVVSEAKKAQLEAREIADLLKRRRPDMARLESKLQYLAQHSSRLNELIASIDAAAWQLNPSQAAEFERMKQASQILNIFVDNKQKLLQSGQISKNRGLLRAKAEGIAKRAEFVQVSALRVRS